MATFRVNARVEVIAGRGQGKTTLLNIIIKALKDAGYKISPPLHSEGKEMILIHKDTENGDLQS